MKKKILVCGSIAYDYLMSFNGLFEEIFKEHKMNALSVSFLADKRERHFGGCGANISYNLSLLGQSPILFSAVGGDFKDYEAWLNKHHVDTSFVAQVSGELTASAYILTDNTSNQIAIFSPGASGNTKIAMNLDELDHQEIAYAIIGPDNPERVFSLVQECIRLNIPYIFDPGQITPILDKDTLEHSIRHAKGLIANEFETEVLEDKMKLKKEDLASHTSFFISTMGEKGSKLFAEDETIDIPAIPAENAVDPTGCGDAFRAGLLSGMLQEKDIKESVQMGTLMGTLTVQEKGTQNHHFTKEDFERYYEHSFK